MKLVQLQPRTLWRLGAIEREPNPTPWASEVEHVILEGVASSHLADAGSALVVVDEDGKIIGAALHFRHDDLSGAQYLAALLLDHRYRGLGLGLLFLTAVVDHARSTSNRPYVTWQVHPDNAPMLAISDRFGAERLGTDPHTGYIQFVHP